MLFKFFYSTQCCYWFFVFEVPVIHKSTSAKYANSVKRFIVPVFTKHMLRWWLFLCKSLRLWSNFVWWCWKFDCWMKSCLHAVCSKMNIRELFDLDRYNVMNEFTIVIYLKHCHLFLYGRLSIQWKAINWSRMTRFFLSKDSVSKAGLNVILHSLSFLLFCSTQYNSLYL